MRILVTRPEPDASRTAARLIALGHQAIVDPVLVFEPVSAVPPKGTFGAVAATSANALRGADQSILAALRPLPFYAVGEHTADAARAAGWKSVIIAEGDVASLAELMRRRLGPGARVVHLAGEDRAADLAEMLRTARIEVETLIVYRMRKAAALSEATLTALAGAEIDAVLHYSRRSAERFAELTVGVASAECWSRLRHLCLSQAVAEPIAALGGRIQIAERPDEKALLTLL